MPDNFKQCLLILLLLIFFGLFPFQTPPIGAYEGIQQYYIRYDVNTSKNKITGDNLLMVPAKDDFRTENFSPVLVSGAISAAQGQQEAQVDQHIKQDCMKKILLQKGLKSVKTKDLDTVISYEGAVITPLKIVDKVYNENQNIYTYTVKIEFSPIGFPDNWEESGTKNRIKKIFYDFFQLFQ